MGFLNKKDRIIDFVLTDKGRELLAKNNFELSYYSFFDNEIDYKTILSSSQAYDGALNNFPILEAGLSPFIFRDDSKVYTQIIDDRNEPKLNISKEEVILQKKEKIATLNDLENFNPINEPIAIGVNLQSNINNNLLNPSLVTSQIRSLGSVIPPRENAVNNILTSIDNLSIQLNNIIRERNESFIFLTDKIFIDPNTGIIYDNTVVNNLPNLINNEIRIFSQPDVDNIEINMQNYAVRDGFLVEVFLSSSGSNLEKISSQDLFNIKSGEILSRGFENWFKLEKDK